MTLGQSFSPWEMLRALQLLLFCCVIWMLLKRAVRNWRDGSIGSKTAPTDHTATTAHGTNIAARLNSDMILSVALFAIVVLWWLWYGYPRVELSIAYFI